MEKAFKRFNKNIRDPRFLLTPNTLIQRDHHQLFLNSEIKELLDRKRRLKKI